MTTPVRSKRHNSILDNVETIKTSKDANINPTTSYIYLSKNARGDKFVSHTLHDNINYVNKY